MLLLAMVSYQMFRQHVDRISLIKNKLLSKFARPLIAEYNLTRFFRRGKLLLAQNRIMKSQTDLML